MAPSELSYILTEERGVPSFDPAHSDTLLNVTFMEQLVGTLVKSAWDGRVENYLADSWETSADGLTYRFALRRGLTCEDGTPITPELYRKNLIRLFRLYSVTNQDIPVFENLVGFQAFRAGAPRIDGIRTVGHRLLEFRFQRRPDGVLEFLSMPYFGFYCDANFDESGRWRDTSRIISSSAWRVTNFKPDQVRLARRNDWPLHLYADAPSTVLIRMLPFEAARKLPGLRTIIQHRIESFEDIPPGYHRFLGTPTDLISVVLSPDRRGPFKDVLLRRKFKESLERAKERMKLESPSAFVARSFYRNLVESPRVTSGSGFELPVDWKGHELQVVLSNALTPNQSSYAKGIIEAAAREMGMSATFQNEDRTQPGWKERLDELKTMDVRVARVDIGGSYEPWVVRMMFCSRLGVSFPDPSGKVCQLTEKMDDRSQVTATRFEEALARDAAVIPLFHTAFSWIVSDDIGMDRFSPTANLLRFEAVQLR